MDKTMNKYIHIASAALLAAICTFLIHLTMKEQERAPFIIKATAQSENNSHFQLYYTETDAEPFSGEKMVNSTQKVTSSPAPVEFIIPVKHISKIRIDFDCYPRRVLLSPITVSGDETRVYNSNQYDESYFIDSATPGSNGYTTFYSNQEDPMIVFHNVSQTSTSHTFSYYLYLTSAFILFIALFFWLIRYLQKISQTIGWHNALFVTVFFLLLLMPISHISKETKSDSENRMLSPRPKINNLSNLDNYGKHFDNWINDHFFGRNTLLKIHSQFSPLESYRNKNAFKGEEQWFFYAEGNSMRNFANIDTFTTEQLVNIANNLEKIDHWCKTHGKKFYFMLNPDKNKVYGEYYKYVNKVRPDSQSRAIQTINYLRKHTNVTCTYTLDSLIKAKETGQLIYYKDDTHWTRFGSYFAYRDVMHYIQKDFDIPTAIMDTFYSYPNYTSTRGDLSRGLPSAEIDTVTIPQCPVLRGNEPTKVSKEGTVFHTIQPEGKHSVLLFGDSFTLHLTYSFSQTFYETSQIDLPLVYIPSEKDKDFILNSINPDCIVMVMVERKLADLCEIY